MEIILATKNEHKKEEILKIFKGMNIKLFTLKDYHKLPDIIEDGKTFEENAIKKAKEISAFTGKIAIADDSGLVVEALDGEPGIYSARYSGTNADSVSNNKKLLLELASYKNKKQRKAYFVCCIVIADQDKVIGIAEGKCHGYITFEEKGKTGFGYDPLFLIPEYNKTFAELGSEIKNKISHRAIALKKMKAIFKNLI